MARRSKKAADYHHLYDLKAWKVRRKQQLVDHPLCVFCLAQDRYTGATVADHVEPHKGDVESFLCGALQSLCKSCHDGAKQRIEKRGYDTACDLDGYPLDPAHPANKPRFRKDGTRPDRRA